MKTIYVIHPYQGERDTAMQFCEELIGMCDEAVVCGDWANSDGCREDLAVAIRLNKPVKAIGPCGWITAFIPAKEATYDKKL